MLLVSQSRAWTSWLPSVPFELGSVWMVPA